jgi:hypothetical protein
MLMSVIPEAVSRAGERHGDVDRRFEAAIIGWARPAVPGRVRTLGPVINELSALGFDLAVVSDQSIDVISAEIGARPPGPGRLLIGVGQEGAVFQTGPSGTRRLASGFADRLELVRWILDDLWSRGIDRTGVVVAGADLVASGANLGDGPVWRLAHADDPSQVIDDQLRRRRRGEIPARPSAGDWCLTVDGFDPRLERLNESLLTLADGCLGTRGAPLVGNGAAASGVFHAGTYQGTGPATELAPLALWARLPNSESLRPSRRTLDLRTGTLYEWGPVASVRFSSLARPGTVVLRVNGDDALLPPAGARTEPGPVSAAVRDVRQRGVLDRFGAYARDGAAAETAATAAAEAGFDGLLHEHREAWGRRWQEADIVIEGDPDLQHAIRFSLFHLMASVGEVGEAAVGARGLSGPAYRGHMFWDSDVFVLPFLAATHPAAARAMLEYRVRRLPAARAAASRLGRSGARFPWESAVDGEDVTPPVMPLPTGDLVRIRTGEHEEHIVADVAWAAARYIDWTADSDFQAGGGRDLLMETAS